MKPVATATVPMTVTEYARLPESGRPTELVRGEVIEMNPPTPRHGQVCLKAGRLLGNFADERQLGHVISNDSGVITERDPDTVRGADVAFYSFQKIPAGPLPGGYLDVPPDLIVEVFSPSDRWTQVLAKAAEYLEAGVSVVCILDPRDETATECFPDRPPVTRSRDETISFPMILPDWTATVREFFE